MQLIMSTILVTGGTGTIGRALTALLLQKGYEVIVLTRNKTGNNKNGPGLSYAYWNITDQYIDAAAVQKADFIIHLAGAGVADKRWSNKRKKEIVESRVKSSALLVKALQENNNAVKTVITASAIGWYGTDPVVPNPRPFVETDPAGSFFFG